MWYLLVKRLVIGTLLLGSLWGLVYNMWYGWQYGRKYETWQTSVQADFPIDLSQTQAGSGKLNQLTGFACHQLYLIQIDGDHAVERELLQGLRGEMVVVNDLQKEVMTIPFNHDFFDDWYKLSDRQLMLVAIRPFEPGHYTIRLQVRSPAKALAGIPHRLVARYQLCGLESMPMVVAYGIAIGCGIATLVFAWLLRSSYRAGIDVTTADQL